MSALDVEDLTPGFGTEVNGFHPGAPLDPDTTRALRDLFDRRGMLVFRDVDLSHAQQVQLCETLIDKVGVGGGDGSPVEDRWYISNRRDNSAAPFGRLQFHSDTMWATQPFEVLSLYGVEVDEPAVPTTFVSAELAWETLPDQLRSRVAELSVLQTAGEVRRGDLTDVLVTNVERPPSTTTRIGHPHPRTGATLLYICEQMTKEVVGLPPDESEALLGELFAHLYDPAVRWDHQWHNGDLVVWDNLAIQHARSNVTPDGPTRTLRKVASPVPQLSPEQRPRYRAAS